MLDAECLIFSEYLERKLKGCCSRTCENNSLVFTSRQADHRQRRDDRSGGIPTCNQKRIYQTRKTGGSRKFGAIKEKSVVLFYERQPCIYITLSFLEVFKKTSRFLGSCAELFPIPFIIITTPILKTIGIGYPEYNTFWN